MKNIYITILLLFLGIILMGQNTSKDGKAFTSPHDVIYNHLYYLQPDTYQPKISAKSIANEGGEVAEEQAIKIKQILDAKGLFVVMSKIPGHNTKDTIEENTYILFPDEFPEIYVEKRNGRWLYSNETIEMIPLLHKKLYPFGSDALLNVFPKFGNGNFLGLKVWQYIGFGIFLISALLFFLFVSKIIDFILSRMAKTRLGQEFGDHDFVHKMARLLGLILAVSMLDLFLPVLQLPIHVSRFIYLLLDVLKYVFVLLLGLRIVDLLMAYAQKWAEKTESKMDDQLLLIAKRFLQIGVVVFGLISILNRLDVNVTALLAGVSIGGLAIALAAQDSVKNLIGALMIFIDRPFDVGDYIIAGSVQGVVQEVGFRSTKLLASDTSLISVPNGKVADEVVNNLGRRVYRRYRTQLGIKYDTPPELIGLFVEGTEEILRLHPHTLDEKTEVHLNNFGPSSLDVFMQTFFTVEGWSEELRSKHHLMLEIIRLAKMLGIEFAFPSQTLYIDKMPEEKNMTKNASVEDKKEKMKHFLEEYRKKLEE